MSFPKFKIVPNYELVHMLDLWKTKGFDPAAAFRFFGEVGKGGFAGVEDFFNGDVLFSENMKEDYETYAELYAVLGGLLDAMHDLWTQTA